MLTPPAAEDQRQHRLESKRLAREGKGGEEIESERVRNVQRQKNLNEEQRERKREKCREYRRSKKEKD